MMEKTKRIELLSHTEVEELYELPEFNAHEQQLYFSLNKTEQAALAQFTKFKTRLYFILQVGYFKAKQQFVPFSFDDVSNDIQFIMNAYYPDLKSTVFTGCISREYIRKQRQAILALYNYRNWSPEYLFEIERHIGKLLKYYPQAHSAFRQLLAYFDHQKITIPSYRTFQDMFSLAFATEKNVLIPLFCLFQHLNNHSSQN